MEMGAAFDKKTAATRTNKQQPGVHAESSSYGSSSNSSSSSVTKQVAVTVRP